MLKNEIQWEAFCEELKTREPSLESAGIKGQYLVVPNENHTHVSLGFAKKQLSVRLVFFNDRIQEAPKIWNTFKDVMTQHDPNIHSKLLPAVENRASMIVYRPSGLDGTDEQVAADWYVKWWRNVSTFWYEQVLNTDSQVAKIKTSGDMDSELTATGQQSISSGVPDHARDWSREEVRILAQSYLVQSNVWWVNHKQTFEQEFNGNYIWSPITKSNGEKNEFYENLKRVRPGDIIFSFANAIIQAVGVCTESAVRIPKPSEFGVTGEAWANDGWKVAVSFSKLKKTIRPKDYMVEIAPTLPTKYSPIRETGDGNQGAYLASVPPAMFVVLLSIIGNQWSLLDISSPVIVSGAEATSDNQVEAAVRNRTEIGETQIEQLVKARRGQGIYRKNLENFEQKCRVTGTTAFRHLRASHILPWRLSNDFEKLDGNNGLLLSPHIDHLFDQGYISFSNDGELLISSFADVDTIAKWHILSGQNCGVFRKEQLPYLESHREFIFRT